MSNDETDDFMRGLVAGARSDLLPKMKASIFCMAVLSGDPDIKLALEVGVALMFDKPIIVVAVGDTWVPARVRQIADAVIEGPVFDDAMKERIQLAITKLMLERGLIQ